MTENIARDYCGEALASAGVKSNGSASSDRDQSKNTAGGDNNKASSRFTMDPKSGLTAEVVKGSGKNIRTETVWIAAAFEILGRVRDPKSEGWARLLRWRDDDGRFHEHPVSDEDLHTDPSPGSGSPCGVDDCPGNGAAGPVLGVGCPDGVATCPG